MTSFFDISLKKIYQKVTFFCFIIFLPEIRPFIHALTEKFPSITKEKNEEDDYTQMLKKLNHDADEQKGREIIQKMIKESSNEISPEFDQKREIGENDSYICELIRQDSIDEFIIHINKINISLSSEVIPSIFETNSLLLKNNQKATLIEYAAFFGSIQIFNYLKINNAKVTPSIFLYAIHSRSEEMIFLLEQTFSQFFNETSQICLKESIKCHHNEIANYIIDKFELNGIVTKDCLHYFNYEIIQGKSMPIEYIIQYDHIKLFEILFDNDNYDNLLKLACQNGSNEIIQFLVNQSKFVIKEEQFKGCKKLTQITIPSKITKISKKAFESCISLRQVLFENDSKLESIDDFAFFCCISLIKISIPSTTKTIGESSFENCLSLNDFKFENQSNIESIGYRSFLNCPININTKKTPIEIQSNRISFIKRLNVQKEENRTEKICLIGSQLVGKTSITTRYFNNTFSKYYEQTIAANSVENDSMHIWDTAGVLRYRTLIPIYIIDTSAILIVFDISNRSSFDDLDEWYDMVKNKTNNMKIMPILVGNKSDLNRTVSREEAEKFAFERNLQYLEVSAKTGSGINELFSYMMTKIEVESNFVEIK